VYRPRGEEALGWKREPLRRFRRFLRGQGALSPERDRAIRREARGVVAEAVRFAARSPEPDPATLEDGVYA